MNKWKYIALVALISVVTSCDSGKDKSNNNGENTIEDSGFELEHTAKDIRKSLKTANTGKGLHNKEQVAEFYQNRDHAPAWKESENRTGFFNALTEAGEEGLRFSDYHGTELRPLLEDADDLNEAEAAELDILLTDAYLSYAHDLYFGKIDPKELYSLWGVPKEEKDLKQLLHQSLNNGDIAKDLGDLRPSHQVYSDLKLALKEFREIKDTEASFKKIAHGELIKPGQKDDRIPAIVNRLQELEVYPAENPPRDSTYNDTMQNAIKDFQKNLGLQVDGVLGNSTISELNKTAAQRYDQIRANLERWRWYPRDLGEHHILINIPAFQLAVVKNGDTVRSHNVIAGTKARQTPVFSDSLEYVVINPEWHVPPTIKSKDVIPKASQNSSYLSRNNMTVTDNEGNVINPSNIDWSSSDVNSYNFVQRAGPSNPLGRVKIIYPNQHLIYLHDTPAKDLFSQNQRAESSGCVRVENALDLSGYVLSSQEDWTQEKIHEAVATGKTQQVQINQPIRVHHFYWTAWRAGDKTVFTGDIYELDDEIISRLGTMN